MKVIRGIKGASRCIMKKRVGAISVSGANPDIDISIAVMRTEDIEEITDKK